MSDMNEYPGVKMDEQERRAWLKSLKAGDVVANEYRAGSELVWEKVAVERVTPTGRIKVRDAKGHVQDYGCGGYLRSGDYWSRSTQTLVPWVDNFQVRMDRHKLEHRVAHYLDMSNCDYAKLYAQSDEALTMLLTMLRALRLEKP